MCLPICIQLFQRNVVVLNPVTLCIIIDLVIRPVSSVSGYRKLLIQVVIKIIYVTAKIQREQIVDTACLNTVCIRNIQKSYLIRISILRPFYHNRSDPDLILLIRNIVASIRISLNAFVRHTSDLLICRCFHGQRKVFFFRKHPRIPHGTSTN